MIRQYAKTTFGQLTISYNNTTKPAKTSTKKKKIKEQEFTIQVSSRSKLQYLMLAILDGFIYNYFDFLVFKIPRVGRTLFWHNWAPIAKYGPKI